MAKAKIAQKWNKPEKVVESPYKIVGSVIRGYSIINLNGEYIFYSENMWDAINEKNRLLNGGTPKDNFGDE
jgi:hypothetical protein